MAHWSSIFRTSQRGRSQAEQAREALNFHITVGILQLAAIVVGVIAWFSMILSVAATPKEAVMPLGGLALALTCFGGFFLVYLWTFILDFDRHDSSSSSQVPSTGWYPLTIRFVRPAP